jgi:clathrin heavy chain
LLQVFNIQEKTKLKGYQMPDAVVYWTWISHNEIAIVTNKSVFHWSTADGSYSPLHSHVPEWKSEF